MAPVLLCLFARITEKYSKRNCHYFLTLSNASSLVQTILLLVTSAQRSKVCFFSLLFFRFCFFHSWGLFWGWEVF